jgi:hypothetical protein
MSHVHQHQLILTQPITMPCCIGLDWRASCCLTTTPLLQAHPTVDSTRVQHRLRGWSIAILVVLLVWPSRFLEPYTLLFLQLVAFQGRFPNRQTPSPMSMRSPGCHTSVSATNQSQSALDCCRACASYPHTRDVPLLVPDSMNSR